MVPGKRGWLNIDPLYLWSAAGGLLAGLVIIALSVLLRS
jgi:hypothetical protein